MAKLVDASVSGAGPVKGVEVRVLFWAPHKKAPMQGAFLYGVDMLIVTPTGNAHIFFW